jgi:hypothetical protein
VTTDERISNLETQLSQVIGLLERIVPGAAFPGKENDPPAKPLRTMKEELTNSRKAHAAIVAQMNGEKGAIARFYADGGWQPNSALFRKDSQPTERRRSHGSRHR